MFYYKVNCNIKDFIYNGSNLTKKLQNKVKHTQGKQIINFTVC